DQKVLSYIGNMVNDTQAVAQAEVNMIHAPRSSGSILKPLLVAAALERGLVINQSLIPDVPIVINGFRPENFSRNYSGAANIHEVIRNSLNIPSVLLLKDLGVVDFYNVLKKLGFSTLFRTPVDYGLSLVLGGAEINMWDLTSAYSYLMHNLTHYNEYRHLYLPREHFHLNLLEKDSVNSQIKNVDPPLFSAASIKLMFDNMRNPYGKSNFKEYTQDKLSNVAWKTGTSFGYKDAWCIGVTPDYTVCVWLGNANGLARPGLIGVETAAPLMFEIINQLSTSSDWVIPYDDFIYLPICSKSGYVANEYCEHVDTVFASRNSQQLKSCPYHHSILLDKTMKYQVFADCELYTISKNYFILPPLMAHYYKEQHSDYIVLPELSPDCLLHSNVESTAMEFIYPNSKTSIVVPIDLDNERNIVIFKAVHKNRDASINWFLDDHFIESTRSVHEVKCRPEAGKHVLTISDDQGQSKMIKFEVER
ncbi:MAG: penicillin-binding transpeptidase domain-containing protein, partial [Saprospiraceae bacterium]